VPALQTDAKVQPGFAHQQAVLTAVDGLRELCDQDLVEMCASGHGEGVRFSV
jgi:hypothetical protein